MEEELITARRKCRQKNGQEHFHRSQSVPIVVTIGVVNIDPTYLAGPDQERVRRSL